MFSANVDRKWSLCPPKNGPVPLPAVNGYRISSSPLTVNYMLHGLTVQVGRMRRSGIGGLAVSKKLCSPFPICAANVALQVQTADYKTKGSTMIRENRQANGMHVLWNVGMLVLAVLGFSQVASAQDFFTVGHGASLPERLIFENKPTNVVGGGPAMGLGLVGDDIDAFSNNLSSSIGNDAFALTFSIERISGTIANPVFISPDLPVENTDSQEQRVQVGADQFGSTEAFRLGLGAFPGLGLNNNVLLINQSPWSPAWSGRRDRGLPPLMDETGTNAGFEEDVNGSAFGSLAGGVYFSVDHGSPSFPPFSGANIYYDPDPLDTLGDEHLFATFNQLGLVEEDEIDALLVWDNNTNGVFDENDHVVFSLASNFAPGGATLYSQPFGGTKTVFAEAQTFGLDVDADIDALSAVALGGLDLDQVLFNTSVASDSAAGDTNGDGLVNIDDLNNVRNNFGAMGSRDGTLPGDAFPFDGLVNVDDLNGVRNNFGAAAANNAASVPEPATALLALLAISLGFLARFKGGR